MKKVLVPALLLIGCGAAGAALAGGEIYGRIETTRGEVLTGSIRWDNNENFWDDTLDARKTERVDEQDPDDGFKLSLFGWKIIDASSSRSGVYRQFSIPFGHLRALEPDGPSAAILELKNGERVQVDSSGSDLGRSLELVIVDADRGPVELAWRRIGRIEFEGSPGEGRDAERLYGTVSTSSGSFTGFIVWDRDESLVEDILDGEQNGRDHEIPFGEIRAIEPVGSSAARVTLASGREIELSGTNDVNDDNRGVLVTVDGIGTIEVPWRALARVVLENPPASRPYDDFDGGRRLKGRVRSRDGTIHSGTITWDMDEGFSWESLDGELEEIDYSVRFENVVSVKPVGSHSAELRLADDRLLVLSGSNDVDEDNRGIMITAADGTETILGWRDVELVEFD